MERCPSCNTPVNSPSNFCNSCGCNLVQNKDPEMTRGNVKRSYRLRSPILESDILYDDTTEKKHGMLIIMSYVFWLFALAFIIYGITIVYKNYTTDLFKAIIDASVLFTVSFLCFMLPGVINILVDIEENLSFLANEARKDKMD